jgi:uncharacterized paraquat-inducible protein A
MSKLLFVIVISLLVLGFLAVRYRRVILFAFQVYRQLKEARSGTGQRRTETEGTALEMRLCRSCNKWFQSKGESVCESCQTTIGDR